jgi:protease IV
MPDTVPSASPVQGPPYFIAVPQENTSGQRFTRWIVRTLLILSILLNFYLVIVLSLLTTTATPIAEKHVSGNRSARNKVAIVRVSGMIAEGMIEHNLKQIEQAAEDEDVKVVVLAVNSPGGTVTASDLLHQHIVELRKGTLPKQSGAKQVIVSMGSIAASGGYYIAAPGDHIFAQPTTITASIGVYIALPEITDLAEKHGVKVNIIKRGELKAGGSPFKKLEPNEAREYSEMIEHSFRRFLKVVEDGRQGKLKAKLRDELTFETLTEPKQSYPRRLADGGLHTAEDALKYGLIDQIGYEREAIRFAAQKVGLTDYQVVEYQRPLSFWSMILGRSAKEEASLDNLPGLSAKLWYLAPGYELTGLKVLGDLLSR